ncbi:hypothetical protein [Ulvibacterium marinum]|uniref:Uncharacterized protein n=1 Tax=Ulvibacterium marinum TaxID=2419782 RepID=A0A3B0CA66_9FLAO|nr:hypothetical protein [Ulvibacterium marinum]RKN83355.1 hypothetical protein D7Z94_05895 [Ulvibacterium marinum]
MWIKLVITVITILLLFDEYFKVIEKVKKKNRRKILLIALALLSILSLVDVVIEVNEGNELIQKANNIIKKSDTLISQSNVITNDLHENIESVKETGESLAGIDSVLKGVRDSVSNQVEILKAAVIKSKELFRLEQQKFELDKPNLIIPSGQVLLVDSNINNNGYDITFIVHNFGNRAAKDIQIQALALLSSNQFIDFDEGKFNTETSGTPTMPGTLQTTANKRLVFNIPKIRFDNENFGIFLVFKISYLDEATGILHQANQFMTYNSKKSFESPFDDAKQSQINKVINEIKRNRINEFLTSEYLN